MIKLARLERSTYIALENLFVVKIKKPSAVSLVFMAGRDVRVNRRKIRVFISEHV